MEKETNAVNKLCPELIDEIIDFVQYCPDSLRSCSRVKRSWVIRSRFHLFRKVHIDRRNHCNNLHAVVQRSPYVASLIRELDIWCYHPFTSLEMPSLPLLLNSLSRLTVLELRGLIWNDLSTTPIIRHAFRNVFASQSLVTLCVVSCDFPLKSFARLLRSCVRLKCISVHYCLTVSPDLTKAVDAEEAGLAEPRHAIQLERLRIDDTSAEFASWITGPDTVFDPLHLHTLRCNSPRHFQPLLNDIGGSLLHLVIESTSVTLSLSIA